MTDTLVGGVVLVLSLVALIGLAAYSVRLINRIARDKLSTARHIVRELNNER